jgi:WD40 repeat protein
VLPVILLAFANDKQNSGAGYLRGLTAERNGIRDALMKAEENGLCQVVVEPDITVDRLFDIFQNSSYRDRIAIFHYGGHAESYSLLLESASGGKATAHSEGLVAFLAKQKSLKLIFLNGCSSQKQSEDLVSAGLPAVIGTSQSINDAVATSLSNRFYKGITAGMSVDRAWTDAVDQIKTENASDNTKALFTESILGAPMEDAFPWKLYVGEGGELSKAWNLPEAANQPLFGLELPKTYYRKLPQIPYPGLRSFTKEEASIFYGRGQDIRKLYTQIGQQQPVILLSGKKGVGKTSLLSAGLIPRLESSFEVAYCSLDEKDPATGLAEAMSKLRDSLELGPITPKDKSDLLLKIREVETSLESTSGFAKEILEEQLGRLKLIAGREHQNLYEQWMSIEEKSGKPLIVVLDELPDHPESWEEFKDALINIFEAKPAPLGKLILSIDSDQHDSFCALLQADQFPFAEVFLQPLTWDGLQEAITGITHSAATKDFYKLEIESGTSNNLPLAITADLSDGDQTLVAPFLQLILSSLWKMAVSDNAQSPTFTLRNYQQAVLTGDIMVGFLSCQLDQLKAWNATPVSSGLALDLLYLHTSALGKSSLLDADKRNQTYKDRQDLVNALVSQCKKLWLLTGSLSAGTRLGHNLLAQVVIREYSVSLDPGQQAARILNARTIESATSDKALWMSEEELEDVEKGLPGMRSLTEKEKELLAFSRIKKLEAQHDRKRRKTIRIVMVSMIAVFGIIAAWQWKRAIQRYEYSRAGELAFYAKEASKLDNTVAINIARKAYSILQAGSPPEVMQTLSEIFHTQDEVPFYAAKFEHKKMVNTAVFSPDGQNVLTASEDGFAKLWDRKGKLIRAFPHETEVFMAAFSPNGQQLLTQTLTNVYLWEKDGQLTDKDTILNPDAVISLDSFSTDGMKLISISTKPDTSAFGLVVHNLKHEDNLVIPSPNRNSMLVLQNGTCFILDKEGRPIKTLPVTAVISATFSSGGEKFLTCSRNADTCNIKIWNEQGDSIFNIKCLGEKVNAIFSPDSKSILTSANGFDAKAWDFTDPFLHRFPRQTLAIKTIDYFEAGDRYLTAGFDSTARIYNGSGRLIDSLKHKGEVVSAFFSPDGNSIITASHDSTSRLWVPKLSKVIVMEHKSEVTSAVFSHDGKSIMTASKDSLIRIWKPDGSILDSIHLHGEITWAGFSPDDSHMMAIASDSTATLMDISGAILHEMKHPGKIFSAAFSPDGQKLLTSCEDNLVRQWSSTGKGEPILILKHAEKPRNVVYSKDGNYIITGGRSIKIWSAEGELEDSLIHIENVSSIAISPDNGLILTTCNDHNSYLWNFNGNLLAKFKGHSLKINEGIFTPDGNHMLTVADDGYILRWNTPASIFDKLKKATIAPLSAKEEERYGVHVWNSYDIIHKIKLATIRLLSSKEEEK